MDLELPAELVPAITAALPAGRLVVRSSSPVEGSGSWSGAFTSYVDVKPDDLSVAIRGCWASMFSRDALGRLEQSGVHAPAGMAVLVQESIEPTLGGVAEFDAGVVTINVADGELADLLQGWCPGHSAVVPSDGDPRGPAVERYGGAQMAEVADLARAVAGRLGDDHIEWAIAAGSCYLLQCRQLDRRQNVVRRHQRVAGLRGEAAAGVARKVARFGGASGDEFVLPWCLGKEAAPEPSHLGLDKGGQEPRPLTMEGLQVVSVSLAAQAWEVPPDQALVLASSVLRRLREALDAEAVHRLSSLVPVDREDSERLVRTIERLGAEQAVAGSLLDRDDVWRLEPEAIEQLLATRVSYGPEPAGVPQTAFAFPHFPGASGWEPFLREAVLANGTVHRGAPASAGIGAGRLLPLGGPRRLRGAHERRVLHVKAPLPAYAPLLWGSAGLVSTTGDSGAHLFDVARSLGVPAAAGVDLADLPGAWSGEAVVAVDGESGSVVVL